MHLSRVAALCTLAHHASSRLLCARLLSSCAGPFSPSHHHRRLQHPQKQQQRLREQYAQRRGMRLVRFSETSGDASPRLGLELEAGGDVVALGGSRFQGGDMVAFLEGGEEAMQAARRSLDLREVVVPRSRLRLHAPVHQPDKVVCVGMNYRDHCTEQNAAVPTEPIIFSKFASAITGPYDDIVHSDETNELDWEVELAFVIGKQGKRIEEAAAMSHVAGFTVAHDVSARDWQMRRNGRQWLLGKTFDSFCPLGPALVTPDELSDPHKLGIRCRVNGQLVQDSSTEQLIFKTEALIAWVSRFVTLYPGDVFLTGTPPGVGVFRKPPVFLKRGDMVECEIDQIGSIANKVV
uniref:Fumarylacetoacetate hydrolase domain-containing protein 2-like isoform X1 n=2 Tax=Petromyzon marinus TaxID=7757 RepID=A0AAJ7SZ37_PETMA|nr:fumarylacetoacetate hydrolase domain-containing protein 2-like isoform X1 [Petromyzon marinus]